MKATGLTAKQTFKKTSIALAVAALVSGAPQLVMAEDVSGDQGKRGIFTISIDNDIITGDDGGYTGGLWISSTNEVEGTINTDNTPAWLSSLADITHINNEPNKHRAVSHQFFYALQTAGDIEIEELVEDEAPYVGLMGWKGTFHAFDENVSDRVSMTVGMVGPAVGGKHVQKAIHKITSSDEPEGWGNQIKNEVVVRAEVDRFWRLADGNFSNGTEYDFFGMGMAGAGNLRSDVGAGVGIRWGRGLGDSFAAVSTLPGREVNPLAAEKSDGWNIYAQVLASYVANDIFIDGNTFEDSHSVELKHEQVYAVTGASFNIGNWAYQASVTWGSDQYEDQPEATSFGSLSVIYRY